MYLRHETGHAHQLRLRAVAADATGRRRSATSGGRTATSTTRNPWSRDYVRYLHRAGMYHYAQKHPDEDWAETFAVWLEGGPLAAPLPRLAGGAGQAGVRRSHRRHRARLPRQPAQRPPRACASRTPRSRRRSPSTSTSTTSMDQDLPEYRRDLLEIFPRRPPRARAIAARGPASRTANAQSAARFIQQHQSMLADRIRRWIGDSDRRVILQLPAPAAGALHRRAHGRSRQPPHREARRADRRRHLARRRRHPPPQLVFSLSLSRSRERVGVRARRPGASFALTTAHGRVYITAPREDGGTW